MSRSAEVAAKTRFCIRLEVLYEDNEMISCQRSAVIMRAVAVGPINTEPALTLNMFPASLLLCHTLVRDVNSL